MPDRRCLLLALFVTLWSGIGPANAATPFDGVSWTQLLRRDPRVHLDSSYTSDLGQPYRSDDGVGGIFGKADASRVVVGHAGNAWLAAVPLDSGGSMGVAGWLLYAPHLVKHIASVAGSDSLRFANGRIVTLDETGGRASGRSIERTYVLRGSAVLLIGKRSVSAAR